jgi:hypothetical protein
MTNFDQCRLQFETELYLPLVQGAKGSSLQFNLISVFPPTYNNRPNGLRKDLMEALAELKPVRSSPTTPFAY